MSRTTTSCLVVCAKRYNGHELWTLLGVLQRRGHTFEVVSTETTIHDEKTFQANTINRTLYDVMPEEVPNFDSLVIVSGNPDDTIAYWDDRHLLGLMIAFKVQEKVLGAICVSAPTLAPVAKGARVSFFPLIRSRKRLEQFGAKCMDVSLTVDATHRLVTAENQMMTEMWAEEICALLEGRPQQYPMQKSSFQFGEFQRRFPKGVEETIDRAYKRRNKQWYQK